MWEETATRINFTRLVKRSTKRSKQNTTTRLVRPKNRSLKEAILSVHVIYHHNVGHADDVPQVLYLTLVAEVFCAAVSQILRDSLRPR